MTTYRLMDGVGSRPGGTGSSGLPSLASYSGPFLAGTVFSVLGQMCWLEGYWWPVAASGQSTAAQKFALWNATSSSTEELIPGSVVTSGTLTAGQWNFVALDTPIQIAPGTQYVACTGWNTGTGGGTGFPDAHDQFNSGAPYVGGITNGPVTAWSDATAGGTRNWPISGDDAAGGPQGLFSVASADPSAMMPAGGSNSANFWVDIQVSDAVPDGYSGSFQMFPNMDDAAGHMADLAKNYSLGTEFTLSEACDLNAVRYYSPATSGQLATDAAIWDVATQTIIPGTHLTSPSWSGAAGSGWVQAAYGSPPRLPGGVDYKVAIFNGEASPDVFSATTVNYFTTGFGASGVTAGPISVPDVTDAAAPGQCTYADTTGSPSFAYPDTYVAGEGQNYWLDVVVTPAATPGGGLLMATFP